MGRHTSMFGQAAAQKGLETPSAQGDDLLLRNMHGLMLPVCCPTIHKKLPACVLHQTVAPPETHNQMFKPLGAGTRWKPMSTTASG